MPPETSSTRDISDALIIGGGVIGLTTALELRRRGLTVTLLEKARPGDGASGAAGGILSPLRPWQYEHTIAALHELSEQCYAPLLDELRAEGDAVPLTDSGLLCLAPGEARDARAWAAARGRQCIELDAAALAREEPALAAGGGFLLPGVCQLEPRTLLDALARAGERRGVRIHKNCAVRTIATAQEGARGKASGAHTDAGFFAADKVVACAGAWLTPLLAPALAQSSRCPAIRPVRGQIIEYAAPPGLLRHIVSSDAGGTVGEAVGEAGGATMDYYLIPRPDGRILVGSTLEECGFDNTTTGAARTELSAVAAQVLPALAQHPIERQWAGLRPAAARPTPIIGAHPEIPGLFINAGHYRNGVGLAPASALLMAQLICGEQPAMEMRAFEVRD